MQSPLLDRTGAVPAQGIDAGVAAHYGDPYAEQRALARTAGLVDRSHREIVRIAGADRLSWLHSLTTQDLQQTTDRIVVGVDASEPSQEALRWARYLASTTGGRIEAATRCETSS